MSNEITFTGSLSCNKPSVMSGAIARSITALVRSMTGNFTQEGTMNVTTAALAVPLGNVTSPHWSFFNNLDATNYITMFNGASGAVFLRLLAGDCAFCPLDPANVPYAQANTAACLMEYLILSS